MARILLLSYEFTPFRGGIATVVEGLATGAAALGHDVHLLAPDYFTDHAERDLWFPFTVHRFRGDFCSILSVDKLTRFAWLCRRAVARLRPDVVHGTDPQSQMALTALSRFRLARDYCFTVHGSELIRYRQESMPRLWMRGAFRRPAAITTVSSAVRDRLLDGFDADPARVFVVHPGIAPHWFRRARIGRQAVRDSWGIEADDVVLITVARRVAEKGHLRAIEALAGLPGDVRRRVAYVVVGGGPAGYARELVRAAGTAGVRLHLAGELDDDSVVSAVDASDLFVMLSERTAKRLEGFGLAYVEAGARGLASLAVDTGGVAEAVKSGHTGLVLREGASAEAVAAALLELTTDGDLRARFGRAAREFAAGFTWQRHATQVYDRFLEVVGRPSAGEK